ncbi:hypothetical protein CC80DRAFT_498812 [Byssothecium circinans]|uniref:Uncharacterized protein n=1 Tax=Byssothecium circinans TaxID=147558 RepID=A0A6A5UI89_9PLEO|nr:hypothetical protein CC80DRAFT_498812 [Byssothecium circinans]
MVIRPPIRGGIFLSRRNIRACLDSKLTSYSQPQPRRLSETETEKTSKPKTMRTKTTKKKLSKPTTPSPSLSPPSDLFPQPITTPSPQHPPRPSEQRPRTIKPTKAVTDTSHSLA